MWASFWWNCNSIQLTIAFKRCWFCVLFRTNRPLGTQYSIGIGQHCCLDVDCGYPWLYISQLVSINRHALVTNIVGIEAMPKVLQKWMRLFKCVVPPTHSSRTTQRFFPVCSNFFSSLLLGWLLLHQTHRLVYCGPTSQPQPIGRVCWYSIHSRIRLTCSLRFTHTPRMIPFRRRRRLPFR